jgi:hypothetical protein
MPQPTERDLMVVQERLADLYASLTPTQQAVLDTIMAAGLSFLDEDDTGGFSFSGDPITMEAHMRSRMAELQEAWRSANTTADQQEGARHLRWDLKPLLDWFNRPQPRPA